MQSAKQLVLLRSTHPSKNHANIGPIDVVASIMLVLVLCTAFPKHNLLKIYPFTSLIRHKPRSSQDASQGYKIRAALHASSLCVFKYMNLPINAHMSTYFRKYIIKTNFFNHFRQNVDIPCLFTVLPSCLLVIINTLHPVHIQHIHHGRILEPRAISSCTHPCKHTGKTLAILILCRLLGPSCSTPLITDVINVMPLPHQPSSPNHSSRNSQMLWTLL